MEQACVALLISPDGPPNLTRDAQQKWQHYIIHAYEKRALRKLVRRTAMPEHFRGKSWLVMSGGQKLLQSKPSLYSQILNTLDINFQDTNCKSLSFNDLQICASLFSCSYNFMRFLPVEDKYIPFARVLHCLHKHIPSLTFCPVLPIFVAICLNWMNENETFATSVALIRRNQFLESPTATWSSLFTLDRLARLCIPDHYASFCLHFGLNQPIQLCHTHPLSGGVLAWFCNDFPFWTVVRIMDIFMTESHKIFYKAGLAVLESWYLHNKASITCLRSSFPKRTVASFRRRAHDKSVSYISGKASTSNSLQEFNKESIQDCQPNYCNQVFPELTDVQAVLKATAASIVDCNSFITLCMSFK